MQISKFMLVVCAATSAASLSAPAADNPAQAKARAALEQKLKALEGQPAATPVELVVQPAAQAPVQAQRADSDAIARAREAMRAKLNEVHGSQQGATAATPAPAPAVLLAQPAATQTPSVSAPQADSAAIARAREAMRAKIVEAQPTTQPVAANPAPVAKAPTAVQKPVAPAIEPAFDANLAARPGANPAAVAKAEEALRQKLDQLQAQPTPVAQKPVAQPAAVTPVKANQEFRLKTAGFHPIAAPELPASITPAKHQRLTELLNRYKADQVTPEEYHNQRAKILAEP